MDTNIEWKARVRDPGRQSELAARLTDGPPERMEQVDTFFHSPRGRLKLRQLAPDQGQMIFYERPDRVGPKASHYSITQTAEPAILHEVLAQALGVRGQVRKRRRLFRAGSTRIHLDEVEGLGTFLEVEVVLRSGQSVAEGERIAAELRRALEVREEDLVEGAYIDLLGAGQPA